MLRRMRAPNRATCASDRFRLVRPHIPTESPHQHTLRQHLLDAADGLAGALFVFYEAESYVAVAVVAEAYAGAYGYFGFVEEELGKLQGAQVTVGFGDLGPDKHGCRGRWHGPAGAVEAFD